MDTVTPCERLFFMKIVQELLGEVLWSTGGSVRTVLPQLKSGLSHKDTHGELTHIESILMNNGLMNTNFGPETRHFPKPNTSCGAEF